MLDFTLNDVTYMSKPPIGEMEMKVLRLFRNEVNQDVASYEKAKVSVDADLEGKEKPDEKKYDNLIFDKMEFLAKKAKSKEGDVIGRVPQLNELFDMAVCDWKSDKHDLPPFPTDRKPSKNVTLGVKQAFASWYFKQVDLTVAEAKN